MRRAGSVVRVVSVLTLSVGMAVAGIAVGASTAKAPERPKISGIVGVEILTSNLEAAKLFYGRLMELDGPCNWCENSPYSAWIIPSGQVLGVYPVSQKTTNLLASVTFAVESEKALKHWLNANHIAYRDSAGPYRDHGAYVRVVDPEGHVLYFTKEGRGEKTYYEHLPVIHAGWVVKDRAAMDKLYKDVLGFHVYWHGGMKDDETNWVDMQVPDGTDWIEYMLNVPQTADQRLRGIMNHIALGVPDVRAAAKQLEAKGWKLPEEPKIGRDGKWQLNLFDPDETRVELMEFTPVEKACCAEYTGPHPKP